MVDSLSAPLGDALDLHRITTLFDELVAEGILVYHEHSVSSFEDKGFKVDFVVTQSQVTKNEAERQLPRAGNNASQKQGEGLRLFGPGSDIALEDDRLLIRSIGPNHTLAFNKFPVFRPQFLLLTKDSFRRQHDALDEDDLLAAVKTLQLLENGGQPYLAFYNCGKAAGSSRDHKHIQLIPKLPHLFPDDPEDARQSIPYVYFLEYLSPGREDQLIGKYRALLCQAQRSLGLPANTSSCQHNVAMTLQWLLVIPRQPADIPVPTPNSAGMVGSVWLPDNDKIEAWKASGLTEIYRACGVPRS